MVHEPRLTQALRNLLNSARIAALGTCEADGTPFVSMVPFAIDPIDATLVIHVSQLAPHTANLQQSPEVSVLIMQSPQEQEPVHALPRVSLKGVATLLESSAIASKDDYEQARNVYLLRFPEAQPMTQLGDFRFGRIRVTGARQVAGFGAARTLTAKEIEHLLRSPS